jgi:hypothetical protein
MNMAKKWWESKTLWANGAALAAAAFSPAGMLGHVLTPGEVGAGLGVLNIALRLFTDKGLIK